MEYTKHIRFQTRTKDISSKRAGCFSLSKAELIQMKLELASLSAVARNHVECTLKWLAASCHLSRFNHRTDTLCANVCVYVCVCGGIRASGECQWAYWSGSIANNMMFFECHWKPDREWKFELLASLHSIRLIASSMCCFVFKCDAFTTL